MFILTQFVFSEIEGGIFDIFSTTASTIDDNTKDNSENMKDEDEHLQEELGVLSLNDLGIAGIKVKNIVMWIMFDCLWNSFFKENYCFLRYFSV